jgi:flagellar hook protein FlgE
MGIYGALSTAVSGLRAQSHALENISGNIANSQTTAYKKIDTAFLDLIPDGPTRTQVPGAVQAYSRSSNDIKGDVKTVETTTNMALNGSGFFVVEPRIGTSDGNPVFAGSDFYTRRGDFDMDKSGMLVNGAGYYLKGLPIDSATGNIAGSVPEVIKISNGLLPAQVTTNIDYKLNLPQTPRPLSYDATVPDSELIPTALATTTIGADKNQDFLDHSIQGGAITVYTETGAPVSVQMRWAKTDSAASGGTDTWKLYYMSDSKATGTDPMWTDVGTDYEFTQGVNDPAIDSITLSALEIDGTVVGDVTLRHGTNGVTQYADSSGVVDTTTLAQNGFAAGKYLSVAVNDSGRIVANYSNGQQVELAQVVTANFNAPNLLKRLDGGVYVATSESGEAVFDLEGPVIGSSLEASNTDISEEFTKLIVTQQAYAAGTRIVSTANDMLQEALNMVR